MSKKIDFDAINSAALGCCPGLLENLLQEGKVRGREYVSSGLAGGEGDSLSVNMEEGVWADFATGEGGSDIVSLVAAIKGIGQGEAARALAKMIKTILPATASKNAASRQKEKPAAILPVPEDTPPSPTRHPRLGKPTDVYAYRDMEGRLLGYVCRFNGNEVGGNGKLKKEFCPLVWTSQGWKWKALPVLRPLYGLERLALASPDAPVLVLEGEGKADAVYDVIGKDVVVLSLNGGASGVGKLNHSPIKGRNVVFWPDNDEPGAKAAKAFLLKAREAGAASVALVPPPAGVPKGWDAGDAVKEGWGREKLLEHINTAHCIDEPTNTNEEVVTEFLPPPSLVPIEAFPTPIAALLNEAAEAFTVPLQIAVACFFAFLSCLVGGARLISFRFSWKESGILWIGIVAPPGLGKTHCAAAFFSPIKTLEVEAFQEWKIENERYELELKFYKDALRKAKEAGESLPEKPTAPKRRQAYVDDSTPEALGEALAENPRGIMWRRDEMAGLITDFDKYSGSKGSTRSRLLSAYDGQEWKTSRVKGAGRNLHISHAFVGLFGGIQPGMLSKIFEAGDGGVDEASGFLQRFIFIRAEREKPALWTEKTFSLESQMLLERIAKVIWNWEGVRRIVSVSSQAKAAFVEWFNGIAKEEFFSENAALLSKLKGQAQRLCLLLHCLEAALSKRDAVGFSVSTDCIRRALLLADWIKGEQVQCWRLFKPEEAKRQAAPIERAIMDVVVAGATRIEAAEWQIGNADFYPLVRKKLNMPELPGEKIGKAVSRLGLKPTQIGQKRLRGWMVTPEIIKSFQAAVSFASSDSTYCNKKDFNGDGAVFEPSQLSHLHSKEGETVEAAAKQCHITENNIEKQLIETVETGEAVDCEENSQNNELPRQRKKRCCS